MHVIVDAGSLFQRMCCVIVASQTKLSIVRPVTYVTVHDNDVIVMSQRDSDAFSVYSFELTPDMRLIPGPYEETIHEIPEESESDSRRGSDPTKVGKAPVQSNGSNKSPVRTRKAKNTHAP